MGTSGTRPDSTRAYHVMRRIFEEGFAAGDASVVDELSLPDLVEHQFGLAATGEQAREHRQGRHPRRARRGAGHLVRNRGLGRAGRQDLGTRPGAGHRDRPVLRAAQQQALVHFTVFDLARVVDGLIVEHWGVPDRFAMLAQTGLLGPLAPADSHQPAGE